MLYAFHVLQAQDLKRHLKRHHVQLHLRDDPFEPSIGGTCLHPIPPSNPYVPEAPEHDEDSDPWLVELWQTADAHLGQHAALQHALLADAVLNHA